MKLHAHLVDTRDLSAAPDPHRSPIRNLYPPPPSHWFRQQWTIWHLCGMDVDEARLKAQIDCTAANLNDLGPWSILVDAEPLPSDHWSYDGESGVLRPEYGYGDDDTVSIEIGY